MNTIKHIALIMDGNGRWAKERSKPRIWGHIKGASKVLEIVKKSCELKVEALTLYAFSTENWNRPTEEVTNLFKLLKKFLKKERNNLIAQNICFSVAGNYRVLDTHIVELIDELKDATKDNTGLKLSLAINYGGRSEIIDAVNSFLKSSSTKEIREEDLTNHLSCPEDVDLLIRTSGEQRVSNFLLWQLCYAEFYFTETRWPDFTAKEFESIIAKVETRERRFGQIATDANGDKKIARNLRIMS